MKKLLILMVAINIGLTTLAQKKSKNKSEKAHSEKSNSARSNNDSDDDLEDHSRHKGNSNHTIDYGKYSKNLPAQVRSSFNRDYKHATHVRWTKNTGQWTANFVNGNYRMTATYRANGQRVYGSAAKNARYRTTSTNEEGSIWEKILTRQ